MKKSYLIAFALIILVFSISLTAVAGSFDLPEIPLTASTDEQSTESTAASSTSTTVAAAESTTKKAKLKASALVITLAKSKYAYSGKVVTPAVTVKTKKGKAVAKKNYSVTYAKGRKNVGVYTVKLTFKGDYTGTVTKSFTIVPKATELTGLTALKKGFKAKWKKQTAQITGYQLQYSTSKSFKNAKTVSLTKTAKTVKKLKKGKKYFVRIRTYKTVGGKTYYSAWSSAEKVKVK